MWNTHLRVQTCKVMAISDVILQHSRHCLLPSKDTFLKKWLTNGCTVCQFQNQSQRSSWAYEPSLISFILTNDNWQYTIYIVQIPPGWQIRNNNWHVSDTFHNLDSHLLTVRRPRYLYFNREENTNDYIENRWCFCLYVVVFLKF